MRFAGDGASWVTATSFSHALTALLAYLWPANQPEPAAWGITYATSTPPASGSLLLLAHHIDITFGDVSVVTVGN